VLGEAAADEAEEGRNVGTEGDGLGNELGGGGAGVEMAERVLEVGAQNELGQS